MYSIWIWTLNYAILIIHAVFFFFAYENMTMSNKRSDEKKNNMKYNTLITFNPSLHR